MDEYTLLLAARLEADRRKLEREAQLSQSSKDYERRRADADRSQPVIWSRAILQWR